MVCYWQEYRHEGWMDNDEMENEKRIGFIMFRRALSYAMRDQHHDGYIMEKWRKWSRDPLWFKYRDGMQWPRFMAFLAMWYEWYTGPPAGISEFTVGEEYDNDDE